LTIIRLSSRVLPNNVKVEYLCYNSILNRQELLVSKAIVTDDELKENSSYKWGVVEKYQITDPGNQDPIEFGLVCYNCF